MGQDITGAMRQLDHQRQFLAKVQEISDQFGALGLDVACDVRLGYLEITASLRLKTAANQPAPHKALTVKPAPDSGMTSGGVAPAAKESLPIQPTKPAPPRPAEAKVSLPAAPWVEPEPEPEPEPKRSPPKAWTDREIAIARKVLKAGGTAKDVAKATGRSEKAASTRCSKLRPDLYKPFSQDHLADEEPASQPDPEPAPQVMAEPAEAWTPALDLQLVEGLMGGKKSAVVAAEMKKPLSQIVERWKELCPDTSLVHQRLLLARLQNEAAL